MNLYRYISRQNWNNKPFWPSALKKLLWSKHIFLLLKYSKFWHDQKKICTKLYRYISHQNCSNNLFWPSALTLNLDMTKTKCMNLYRYTFHQIYSNNPFWPLALTINSDMTKKICTNFVPIKFSVKIAATLHHLEPQH